MFHRLPKPLLARVRIYQDHHIIGEPITPHNCGGPVLHFASLHLAANVTNLYILESVRRHYLEEYKGLLTADHQPVDGEFPLPPGPGLGVELNPNILKREDVSIERTSA